MDIIVCNLVLEQTMIVFVYHAHAYSATTVYAITVTQIFSVRSSFLRVGGLQSDLGVPAVSARRRLRERHGFGE